MTFNICILVATAIGAFAITHIVLRWQTIGLMRLMFPFVIVAGALTALLMEKKIVRLLGLPIFAATALIYFVYWTAHIARRNEWTDKPILSQIARLQNPHSYTATVQRKGQPSYELFIPEDFRLSYFYIDILKHSKQPAVFGLIGHGNSDPYDLFGDRSQNQIVALVDCRDDEKIMDPPRHLDYVVAEDRFAEARAWAQAHGFEETASYSSPEKEMFVTFAKKSP